MQLQAAQKMMDEMEAKPLLQSEVKGKVEAEYLGYCGFKYQWVDSKNTQRVIYMNFT